MDPFSSENEEDKLFEPFNEASDSGAKQGKKQTIGDKRKREELDTTLSYENGENKSSITQSIDLNMSEDDEEEVSQDSKMTSEKMQLENIVGNVTEEQVDILKSKEACLHDIAYPPDYNPSNENNAVTPNKKPAKEYPFVLDAFQRESVKCLENGESVLVSAHTSAGKTAVAEYAIAMAFRDGSRVVYTSPIKALSNQKFRELSEEFKDVGLMTGDVTINPNATCLVMTTEILRSMLYRGSEILIEVAWVIFDEVHYMRDKERGVVWEETMILLPNTVRYVFLSATIPNAKEFAEWIAKLKGQPVHVVYTEFRPTPLQHYIYPSGGDGILLVVNEKSQFRDENFQKAIAMYQQKNMKNQGGASGSSTSTKKRRKMDGASDIYKIVKMIMERNFQPVIVFSFSRKDCESLAVQMKKLDLNDEEEKTLVEEVFNNAIDSLSDEDKKLPQVEHMLPLLKRGIGIHHSGLLPIIKEVIEILFQEGLVKALFSTETFSLGLNMPARTVVFTQITKFDGQEIRMISSGEYIQMSGRAGRRGIDDKGITIIMLSEDVETGGLKQMLGGKADPLNSSFRLSYYMLLNLLRVDEITPEYIMERSFYQFQSEKQRPALKAKLEKLEKAQESIVIPHEQQVASYYDIMKQLEKLKSELREIITQPIHILPFIQPGRVIRVKDNIVDWGWGIVINCQKVKGPSDQQNISVQSASDYVVDVLLHCSSTTSKKLEPLRKDEKGEMHIIPMQLNMIESICSARLYINKNMKTEQSKETALLRLNEFKRRFPDGLPLLDPIEDMKIESKHLSKIIKKIEVLEQRLQSNQIHKLDNVSELVKKYREKELGEQQIKDLKLKINQAGQIVLKEDLKKMMRVLRRLGCITSENVMDVKGRVAAEISAGDELLVTELMFNGVFNDLSPEQVVSLVSCLVFNERASDLEKIESSMPKELLKSYQQLQESAKKIARVYDESKIVIDQQEYVNSFSPALMEVTFAWCNGSKFYDICKMTDTFEGTIVRCMRRLEELLRQMCVAAKSIGENTLEEKFLTGIQKLKRDIVFSSSLYI